MTAPPRTPGRPAIFFDRDGVINEDTGYVGSAERFRLLPDVVAAVRLANDSGVLTFLVTNQSGVARGYYSEDDVLALHGHLAALLAAGGARFDDIRYCPHLPDAPKPEYRRDCSCRKPRPGMIVDLLGAHDVDASRSVMIGDKPSDVEAAEAAGIRGRLYRGEPLLDVVRSVLSAIAALGRTDAARTRS